MYKLFYYCTSRSLLRSKIATDPVFSAQIFTVSLMGFHFSIPILILKTFGLIGTESFLFLIISLVIFNYWIVGKKFVKNRNDIIQEYDKKYSNNIILQDIYHYGIYYGTIILIIYMVYLLKGIK